MTTEIGAPIAVPGFEILRWREPLPIAITPKHDFNAQLVGRGRDVGVVYETQIEGRAGAFLASLTLEGALDVWPPVVGPPTLHGATVEGNRPPWLVAWSRDEVLASGVYARWLRWGRDGSTPVDLDVGAEGVTATGPSAHVLIAGSKPEHGVYVVAHRHGKDRRLSHRAAANPAVVTDLGAAPDTEHLVVLADGSLLAVTPKRKKRRNLPPPGYVVTVLLERFGTGKGGGSSRSAFELPPNASLKTVIAARDGGAFLACWSRSGEIVIRVDAAGEAVGEGWRPPLADATGPSDFAIAAWREGFVISTWRDGAALIASDGSHATRVDGKPGGAYAWPAHLYSLAIAPDERSILLVHHTSEGIQVLRADFEPLAPGMSPPDAWSADRELVEKRLARPETPPLPGCSLESNDDGSEPAVSHRKARIVRQLRVHHLLSAISGLHFEHFAHFFRGDDDAGEYHHEDGSGGREYFAWSADGLVGASDDADLPGLDGRAKTSRSAARCFSDAPATLQPLVQRAVAAMRGRVAGGVWVTTGNGARWNEAGSFHDGFERFTMTPVAAVFEATPGSAQSWLELASMDEAHGKLALALAEKSADGPHVLTEDEEATLLTSPREARGVAPKNVDRAARALADAGITWADPAGGSARRRQGVLDAIGAPQVALLHAASRGDVRAATEALDAGADVECVAPDEMLASDEALKLARMLAYALTPLSLAAASNAVDVIELLLERGARLDEPTRAARPPAVHVAALKGQAEALGLLLTRSPAFDPASALEQHLRFCHPPRIEVVRLLVARIDDLPSLRLKRSARDRLVTLAEAAGDEELAARFRAP